MSLLGEGRDREQADEEDRAFQTLRELQVRATSRRKSWQSEEAEEFRRAQSQLHNHSREDAEKIPIKASLRSHALRTPEPAPALEEFFPDGAVLTLHTSPELLADIQQRHRVALQEHAQRERGRLRELEYWDFRKAQRELTGDYSREAVGNDSYKVRRRIELLQKAEPIPELDDFIDRGAQQRAGTEVLAAAQMRYAAALDEHAERERLRVRELEDAEALQAYLEEEERARGIAEQATLWPRGTTLSPEVADIYGIADQVQAQNSAIERTVDALTQILANNLPSAATTDTLTGDARDTRSIAEHAAAALAAMAFAFDYTPVARAAYTPDSRQLVVECELPNVTVIPAAKSYRYVKSRHQVVESARSASQVKTLYANAIAQLTLVFLAASFASDIHQDVDVVVLNGVVDTIDPRTGSPARPCLITVRVTRETFAGINLTAVDPQACLKHLSAGVSRSPTELAPVKPVLEFSMVDPRFVAATATLSSMDDRPNLMELSPIEFEGLIENLFAKMGLETRQTRPSRDGGVDCIAYDARPILGGKFVIQAKRYKNTVGVSAVRDLYGTLQNEGASKGILVTTSGYGQASFDFAQNKPIELIEGANLLYLLETHAGIRARIEPPEGWRDPVADSPIPDFPSVDTHVQH